MELLALTVAFALLAVPIMIIISLGRLSGIRRAVDEIESSQKSMHRELTSIKETLKEPVTIAVTDEDLAEATAAPAAVPETPEPITVAEAAPEPVAPPIPAAPVATPPPPRPKPYVAATAKSEPEPSFKIESVKKAPNQLSKIAETASSVLNKIWSWVLVGKEHRPKNMKMEYAIASTWLMRAGIIVFVGCVVFFLKWSIEKGIMTEWMRVGSSIIAGVLMMVFGVRLAGKKYDVIGQGLMGGGIAVLYFSMYSAGMMYDLVDQPQTFALMILVTIAAGVLSVRTNSMLIAIFGIVGGYSTPILLSTGSSDIASLYSYMLMLSIGVAVIARYKQWRLLNYLAFIFTWGIALTVTVKDYSVTDFPLVISFFAAFFLLHSWIIISHNILKKNPCTGLELAHLLANVVVFAVPARWLIKNAYPGPYTVILTVSLAAFYVAQIFLFLKLKRVDRGLLLTLLSLAGLFTAISLPILFEKESLTICLSLLALTYMVLSMKMRSNFLRSFSHVLYVIVFARLVVLDTPSHFGSPNEVMVPVAEYWTMMLDRLWTFATSIGSILFAFVLQRREISSFSTMTVVPENDTEELVAPTIAANVLHWFGVLFMFGFILLELSVGFHYYAPLRLPIMTTAACIFGLYFMWRYIVTEKKEFGVALSILAAALFLKLLLVDLKSWGLGSLALYHIAYSATYVGMRLLDFGAILIFLLLGWRLLRTKEPPEFSSALGYGALAISFLYLSLELNSCLYAYLQAFRLGGISILWAILAVLYVGGGIWKDVRPLRFIGLILFTVITGKVFFVDLAHIEGIYRVLAFMFVGGLMLLGSFVYLYSSGKFQTGDTEEKS